VTKSDFDKFVKRQQSEQKKEASFEPRQQLEQWLNYLGILYDEIGAYLQTYIASEDARIEFRNKSLNEDFIGSYVAREMIIKIGHASVTFTPVGTMLVGAKGRVDVDGPAGTATLLLVDKLATTARSLISVGVAFMSADDPRRPSGPPEAITHVEWVWKIASPPPEIKFTDLTQEAFFDMVLEVANG